MASPNPHHDANHELLSQEMKPLTDATLTIRVIKSFPFRTCKNLVLRDLDLTAMTVGELMERCKKGECELGAAAAAGCLPLSTFKLPEAGKQSKHMGKGARGRSSLQIPRPAITRRSRRHH